MFPYLFERQFSHEFLSKEDHPCDPEEKDVMTRLEKWAGIEKLELVRVIGPTEYREWEEGRWEPSVQHVRILNETKQV